MRTIAFSRLITCLLFITAVTVNVGANVDSLTTTKLKVGVNLSAPLAHLNGKGEFSGPMVDLWKEVAESLEFEYELFPTDMVNGLNGLQDGSMDLLIGGITVTADREKVVDFGPSILPSGIATVVSEDKIPNKFETYYKPILLSLLRVSSILLGFMMISALLVWMAERKEKHHKRDKQIRHFGDGVWWSAVTLTTVGYGDKVPHTRIGRFIGITWIFLGVVLISFFTANTAAILSQPDPALDLRLTDIREVEVGAVEGSAAAEFLLDREVQFKYYDEIATLLTAVSNSEIEVGVGNVPEVSEALHSSTTHNLIHSKTLLAYTFMAWAFPEDSLLLEVIDESLLNLTSQERWQRIFSEHIKRF